MVIDERRSYQTHLKKQSAVVAPPTSPTSPNATTALTSSNSFPREATYKNKSASCCFSKSEGSDTSLTAEQRQGLALRYVNAITSTKGVIIVMFIYLGSIAGCGWAMTNLNNDFSVTTVIPDDSYAREFFDVADEVGVFWNKQIPYDVVFKGSESDISDPEVQADAISLLYDLSYNTGHSRGPPTFWLNDFLPWCANQSSYQDYITTAGYFNGSYSTAANTVFETAVADFLSTSPYDRYDTSVILKNNGQIKAHRAKLYHYHVKTSDDKVHAMVAAYKACDKSEGFNTKSATPYARTSLCAFFFIDILHFFIHHFYFVLLFVSPF
jgi:hypothetical protein